MLQGLACRRVVHQPPTEGGKRAGRPARHRIRQIGIDGGGIVDLGHHGFAIGQQIRRPHHFEHLGFVLVQSQDQLGAGNQGIAGGAIGAGADALESSVGTLSLSAGAGGAFVTESVMRNLDLRELEICPWALREGIVLKYMDWMENR